MRLDQPVQHLYRLGEAALALVGVRHEEIRLRHQRVPGMLFQKTRRRPPGFRPRLRLALRHHPAVVRLGADLLLKVFVFRHRAKKQDRLPVPPGQQVGLTEPQVEPGGVVGHRAQLLQLTPQPLHLLDGVAPPDPACPGGCLRQPGLLPRQTLRLFRQQDLPRQDVTVGADGVVRTVLRQ